MAGPLRGSHRRDASAFVRLGARQFSVQRWTRNTQLTPVEPVRQRCQAACSTLATAVFSPWSSVSAERLVSRGRIDLVSPGMDDGLSVEVIEVGEDPRFEFLLGCNANAAKHGSSHLGEEAFHQIKP